MTRATCRGLTLTVWQGFRMLVGDASQREKRGEGKKSQSCFRCFTGPDFQGDDLAPCADPELDTEELPSRPCHGIRSNVVYPTYVAALFPSCLSVRRRLASVRRWWLVRC